MPVTSRLLLPYNFPLCQVPRRFFFDGIILNHSIITLSGGAVQASIVKPAGYTYIIYYVVTVRRGETLRLTYEAGGRM